MTEVVVTEEAEEKTQEEQKREVKRELEEIWEGITENCSTEDFPPESTNSPVLLNIVCHHNCPSIKNRTYLI